MTPRKELPEARFQRQPIASGDCSIWQGACNGGGYGKFWFHGKTIAAHRYAYEVAKGPIPEGMTIDHLCRVRNCVNPDHMEAVSIAENLARAVLRPENRTHCPQGHAYSPENTKVISGKKGSYRSCLTCSRFRSRMAARARFARLKARSAP